MRPKILAICDEQELQEHIQQKFSGSHDILIAGDFRLAMKQFIKEEPVLVLIDLDLAAAKNIDDGMETLVKILQVNGKAKVIVMAGAEYRGYALGAASAGAQEFISKPLDMDVLTQVLGKYLLVSENKEPYLECSGNGHMDPFQGMVATSPKMVEIFKLTQKVARSNATVLILGEVGTGKEIVANAIHRQGEYRQGPFISVNCNAIPMDLMERELFGGEKKSLEGSRLSFQHGIIESAEGGTLFLDEIDGLPMTLQIKLLKFVQNGKVQRLGSREEIKVETRIIAATNIDLEQAVAAGKFREDLYLRLSVVSCKLPPLRERGEDVILIANEFLRCFSEKQQRPELFFSKESLAAIVKYPWPGNVRELQNRIHRAVILADSRQLTIEDMGLSEYASRDQPSTLKEARERIERSMVRTSLNRHRGNISAAAAELGVSRPTFYELMGKLKISKHRVG